MSAIREILLTKKLVPPFCWLMAGGAALCLFRLLRGNTTVMDWWKDRVSMPWKRFAAGLVDGLPFSAAEGLITLFVLGAVVLLVWGLLLMASCPWAGARCIAWLAALGLWAWVLVTAFWGTQYYGTQFPEKIGLADEPISAQRLDAVTVWFAEQVNRTAGQVPRDETGLFSATRREILAGAPELYRGVETLWPCLAGPERRVKASWYSRIMSVSGFTGYIFGPLGESTVNREQPPCLLGSTVAHELAHQRGVAPEQEANFCAVVACELSGNPVYEYSGWLFGYIHLSNAVWKTDKARASQIAGMLCPEAQRDLAGNSTFWAQFDSPVQEAVQSGYSGFLNSYGQTMGMASYGACVDLLAAWYGERAEGGA